MEFLRGITLITNKMKKQSSIENLHEESSKLIYQFLKGHLSSRDLIVMHHNLYYESKEMHKQEIIEAREDGFKKGQESTQKHV